MDCHARRRVPPDTPGFPAYGRMLTAPLPMRGAAISYLRTVIVTAAVYRGFNSGLAALLLTFRHRAGVSPYTSPSGFAETCVFSKQSVGPLSCDLQMLEVRDLTHPRAPLLPKLRGYFAEFLSQSSLDRLGILLPSTSVGLRYGHPALSLEAFLGSMGSATSPPLRAAPHQLSGLALRRIFQSELPTALAGHIRSSGWPTLLRP